MSDPKYGGRYTSNLIEDVFVHNDLTKVTASRNGLTNYRPIEEIGKAFKPSEPLPQKLNKHIDVVKDESETHNGYIDIRRGTYAHTSVPPLSTLQVGGTDFYPGPFIKLVSDFKDNLDETIHNFRDKILDTTDSIKNAIIYSWNKGIVTPLLFIGSTTKKAFFSPKYTIHKGVDMVWDVSVAKYLKLFALLLFILAGIIVFSVALPDTHKHHSKTSTAKSTSHIGVQTSMPTKVQTSNTNSSNASPATSAQNQSTLTY